MLLRHVRGVDLTLSPDNMDGTIDTVCSSSDRIHSVQPITCCGAPTLTRSHTHTLTFPHTHALTHTHTNTLTLSPDNMDGTIDTICSSSVRIHSVRE